MVCYFLVLSDFRQGHFYFNSVIYILHNMVKYGLEKLMVAITFNMLKNLSTFKLGVWQWTYRLREQAYGYQVEG